MMKKIKKALQIVFLINSLVIQAQKKDTIIFKDYYLCSNIISRIGVFFDVGVERIKPLKKNIYYASQISITANLQSLHLAPQNLFSPAYYGISLQPFHLLIGNALKFETGPSFSYLAFRFNGKRYPVDTVRVTNTYNNQIDAIHFSWLAGFRYTFKKPQISIKIIMGPKLFISLQKKESLIKYDAGEMGISWRFRKKKAIDTKNLN